MVLLAGRVSVTIIEKNYRYDVARRLLLFQFLKFHADALLVCPDNLSLYHGSLIFVYKRKNEHKFLAGVKIVPGLNKSAAATYIFDDALHELILGKIIYGFIIPAPGMFPQVLAYFQSVCRRHAFVGDDVKLRFYGVLIRIINFNTISIIVR